MNKAKVTELMLLFEEALKEARTDSMEALEEEEEEEDVDA